MRYGIVIDLQRCISCNSCALACKAEHGTPPGVYWSKVLVSEHGKFPSTNFIYLPVLCMHCENAPCQHVCPTGATYKRDDGIVLVNYDACMGCRYCELACPYDARSFIEEIKPYFPEFGFTPYEEVVNKNHAVKVEEKCTMCSELVDAGKEPACVVTCPAYARYFGDLDDPASEVNKLINTYKGRQLHPELGTEPAVYYIGG